MTLTDLEVYLRLFKILLYRYYKPLTGTGSDV